MAYYYWLVIYGRCDFYTNIKISNLNPYIFVLYSWVEFKNATPNFGVQKNKRKGERREKVYGTVF